MDSYNRLGINIRSLREAFGETGTQLAKIIHVEKNTISSYESGRTKPSHDTLIALATHFSIPIDELLLGDYSSMPKLSINLKIVLENIDFFLPIVSSDCAMENPDFKEAYKIHEYMNMRLKRGDFDDEILDSIIACIDKYGTAMENNPDIESEVASNILALYFLQAMFLNSAMMISNRTAPIVMLSKQEREIKKKMQIIEEDKTFKKDLESLIDDFREENKEEISDLLSMIKNSGTYSDLADYYLALQYIFRVKDNNYDLGTNQQIGFEMMDSFASVGNTYAQQYISLVKKAMTHKGSQIVD